MAQHEDREAKALKRKQEAHQRQVNIEIDAAIAHLLKMREGRRFLWWLLQIGKVNQQPFTMDARTTAFNCGELNVGQQVLARITLVQPAGYLQMQEENLNEYNARVRADADARTDSADGDANAGNWDAGADSGPDTVD